MKKRKTTTRAKLLTKIRRVKKRGSHTSDLAFVGKPRISVMAMDPEGESPDSVVIGERLGQRYMRREVKVVLADPRRFAEQLDHVLKQVRAEMVKEYTGMIAMALGES